MARLSIVESRALRIAHWVATKYDATNRFAHAGNQSPVAFSLRLLPMVSPTHNPPHETETSVDARVVVDLGDRSYSIEFNQREDTTQAASDFVNAVVNAVGDCSHIVVIADQSVASTSVPPIASAITDHGIRLSEIHVVSGETSKSIAEFDRLSNELLACHADRRTVVVAVGGGVIGDLAGFVAATFTRGLRLIQVPTTLLSMVDSSVGGKTGINLPGGKNLVGCFWQPHLVWIDPSHLATLPDRDFQSGLAEVIKYGVIENESFFQWLESSMALIRQRDANAIRHVVAESCRCKARVVADDERETTGRRAILNYGHTFAHAIESTAGYGHFLHGEAVAIGMQMAARLAIRLERCPEDLLERQTCLLTNAGLPIVWPDAKPDAMLQVMSRDKKVQHGQLRFVLPSQLGHVDLVSDVQRSHVIDAIESTR
ncbi:MAG: 3-dehydroquinate synthase [Planctomycetota bacterium]